MGFTLRKTKNEFTTILSSQDYEGHISLYEIDSREKDGGRRHRCVLEASSKDEAIELFLSLPQVRNVLDVLDVNRIVHRIYWIE